MIKKNISIAFVPTIIFTAPYSYSSVAPSGEYQVWILRYRENNKFLKRQADLPDPNQSNTYSYQRAPHYLAATDQDMREDHDKYLKRCSDAHAQRRQIKLNQSRIEAILLGILRLVPRKK